MTYLNALPQSLMTVLNLADRVATVTTTIARAASGVWSFLTQPQAIETYRWLGAMTLALIELVIWSILWVYAQVALRFEPRFDSAEINLDLQSEYFGTVEELFSRADTLTQLTEIMDDVLAQKTQPQVMATPAPSISHEDGLDRQIELSGLTLDQLKAIAQELGLATRKVKKANLINQILTAEGYEI